MSHPSIECPYCGTLNPIGTGQTTITPGVTTPLGIGLGVSLTRVQLSCQLKCILCGRTYRYIGMNDYSWIKKRLAISDSALTSLKSIFGNVDLDNLFTHVVGITMPMKKILRIARRIDRALHICFKYKRKRVYLACQQERNNIKGKELYRS